MKKYKNPTIKVVETDVTNICAGSSKPGNGYGDKNHDHHHRNNDDDERDNPTYFAE